MNWKPANPQRALRLVAAVLLLAGLLSGGGVWLTAEDVPEDHWTREFQGSKAYRRNLEIYGGKLNVIGDDLSRWYAKRWQGRQLAYTIVVLAAGTSLLLLFVAGYLPPPHGPAKAEAAPPA